MKLEEFSNKLLNIYSDDLLSLIVYGSAVSENEYSNKFSDINLIIILKDLAPTKIQLSNKLVRKWIKSGNPVPLFFDLEHIKTSTDVFPVEFLDIKDRHKVIVGDKDFFKDINIDYKNLRHQCESELKGMVLQLRSYFAANCNNPKLIAKAVMKTWPGLRTTLRATTKLIGETIPDQPKAMVEVLAARMDFNPEIFFDIIAIRDGSMFLPRKSEALEFFEQYLTELKSITSFIDKLNTEAK